MRKKIYGSYQEDKCPFCASTATVKSKEGIPTCDFHKKENIGNLKCVCGSHIDIKQGKFGVFFNCINCGNISQKKGFEMNGYPLKTIEEL